MPVNRTVDMALCREMDNGVRIKCTENFFQRAPIADIHTLESIKWITGDFRNICEITSVG
jgi:hypothetical protein